MANDFQTKMCKTPNFKITLSYSRLAYVIANSIIKYFNLKINYKREIARKLLTNNH